jgi:hypothetical protein
MNYIFFIILAYTILEAKADANLLNKGYFIHEHTTRFLRRSLVVLSIGLLVYLINPYEGTSKAMGYCLLFATTFDNILNVMRGKYLFKLGRTASWDVFWRKRKVLYIAFVIIGFALSIYLNFFN